MRWIRAPAARASRIFARFAACTIRARPLALALVLLTACQAPVVTPPSPTPPRFPRGGVLVVDIASPPASIAPPSSDAGAVLVARQVFEGLVSYEPGTLRLVPQLAESWTVSADRRTWAFTLRDGVRFHDGTALDADVAAASLRRIVLPVPARVEVVGARSVSLTTEVPYGPLLAVLALPGSSLSAIADPRAGTGPFVLVSSGAGGITLAANPTYWRRDVFGEPLPRLDGIAFNVRPEAADRVADLRSGSAHLSDGLSGVDLAAVRANPNLELRWRSGGAVIFLGIALSAPPFSDLAMRRALAEAIDSRAVADRAAPEAGSPATQLIPPGVVGFDDSVVSYARHDVEAARRVLAQLAGQPIEIWAAPPAEPGGIDPRRVADAVATELSRAGLRAVVRATDAVTRQQSARSGTAALWVEDHLLAFADGDAALGEVLGARGGWVNAPAQALLDAARAEVDSSKRGELYKQVSKLAQQHVARIPLMYGAWPVVTSRRVSGVVGQPLAGESFAEITLER